MSVSFRLRQGYGGPAKALATAGRLASQAKDSFRSEPTEILVTETGN